MNSVSKFGTHLRTKIQRFLLHGSQGTTELRKEQRMEVVENEGVHSEETSNGLIIGGEKIVSHLQIQGECEFCLRLCTARSIRYCFCGAIMCVRCSKWWNPESRPVCPQCYERLRWKRLWSIVFSPFFERSEK